MTWNAHKTHCWKIYYVLDLGLLLIVNRASLWIWIAYRVVWRLIIVEWSNVAPISPFQSTNHIKWNMHWGGYKTSGWYPPGVKKHDSYTVYSRGLTSGRIGTRFNKVVYIWGKWRSSLGPWEWNRSLFSVIDPRVMRLQEGCMRTLNFGHYWGYPSEMIFKGDSLCFGLDVANFALGLPCAPFTPLTCLKMIIKWVKTHNIINNNWIRLVVIHFSYIVYNSKLGLLCVDVQSIVGNVFHWLSEILIRFRKDYYVLYATKQFFPRNCFYVLEWNYSAFTDICECLSLTCRSGACESAGWLWESSTTTRIVRSILTFCEFR